MQRQQVASAAERRLAFTPACRVVGFSIPSGRQCTRRDAIVNRQSQGHLLARRGHSPSNAASPPHPTRRAQHARVQQAVGAAAAARTVVAAAAAAQVPEAAAAADAHASVTFDLACPICHTTPLRLRSAGGAPQGNTHCPRCARTFACGGNGAYADLTLTSGVQQAAYEQRFWGGTSIFQSPLVSFVYERGWRQGFAWAGERAPGRGCWQRRHVRLRSVVGQSMPLTSMHSPPFSCRMPWRRHVRHAPCGCRAVGCMCC